MANVKVQSIISKGSKGILVDIECHLSNNLPTIVIVGSANKAVDEARERIRGAFSSSQIVLPRKRVTINLAPADVPKVDSGFDMAIAVSILFANKQIGIGLNSRQAFIGELGLDGNIRAVRAIIGKIMHGREHGLNTFFVPYDNIQQAQLVPKVRLVPIKNLQQLHNYLKTGEPIGIIDTGDGKAHELSAADMPTADLSQIVGQDQAKYAIKIAAAGGHNLFLHGPPGTGKSMLAKALPSILPPLNREEMLEVTHLHSLANQDYDQLITQRPFRAPHHSASHVAVVGGGSSLRPGEISLAHRGVLFFDELPEFDRDTIEALRQPLEDRVINVARVKEMASFPANFIFVATANPCPCGYKDSNRQCDCSPTDVKRYTSHLSGPIMDRFDLHCKVDEVDHTMLLLEPSQEVSDSQKIRQRITQARQIQADRFKSQIKLNNDMTNDEIRQLANLTPSAQRLLNQSAVINKLSGRAYMRAIKVARTIADMYFSEKIIDHHMAAALHFKQEPPKKNDV